MITASHNPPNFNGYKLKGPHGGSVDKAVTEKVEGRIGATDARWQEKPAKRADLVTKYIAQLKKWVPTSALGKLRAPVVLDAMHGPGGVVFRKLVGSSNKFRIIRDQVDPLFGGNAPEPIERKFDGGND